MSLITKAIAAAVARTDLDVDTAAGVMDEIMTGACTPAQIAAYLVALRMKGETVAEIVGSARVMRRMATPVAVATPPGQDVRVIDTCGTGGDGAGTFNISTTVALVAAGGGLTVAKHGNRAISGRSGSADVLTALGVNVDATVEVVEKCLAQLGIGFLFAPRLHGAMRHAIGPRREVGIRTLFNVLGPLTNPAGATHQVLGVYAPELTDTLAHVLLDLGTIHCFVVHGSDGLDEITTTGPTTVAEGHNGIVKNYTVDPSDVGIPVASPADLVGGDATENAEITRAILAGQSGPKRDVVLMNAAPVFMAAGVARTWADGIACASDAIDTGRAAAKLDALIQMTAS